eukprot:scaffold228779_cov76-Cyclotella_meneghiniana.AAC.4
MAVHVQMICQTRHLGSRNPNFAEVLSTPLSTIFSHPVSQCSSQADRFNHRHRGIEFVEQNSELHHLMAVVVAFVAMQYPQQF